MARVTYAPIVGNASGRVAGTIFSTWRGISYAKRFAKPGNPNTVLQQGIRNAFKDLTVIWKLLDAALVGAWSLYAKGKGFTNRNSFLGQNVLFEKDSNPLTVAPHNPKEFPVNITNTVAGADQFTVNWTWPDTLASNKVRIYYRKSGLNEMIFFSEETYPTVTKVVTGFTGAGAGVVFLAKKNNTTGEYAQSDSEAFSWT